jgi:hypothetical protein
MNLLILYSGVDVYHVLQTLQLQTDLESCLQHGKLEVVGSGSMGSGVSFPVPEFSSGHTGNDDQDNSTGTRLGASGQQLTGMRLVSTSTCSIGCAHSKSMPRAQDQQQHTVDYIPDTSRSNGTCEYSRLPGVIKRCENECGQTKAGSESYQRCQCVCQRQGFGFLRCQWAKWMACSVANESE